MPPWRRAISWPAEVSISAGTPPDTALTNAKGMAGNVVLVADDNKDSSDSLRDLDVHFGHQAHVAYDGHAALSLGAAGCPDIALLDIHMPGMDGFSVAKALRSACGPGAVLVAITGAGAIEAEAYRAGFDIYLAKPQTQPFWSGSCSIRWARPQFKEPAAADTNRHRLCSVDANGARFSGGSAVPIALP